MKSRKIIYQIHNETYEVTNLEVADLMVNENECLMPRLCSNLTLLLEFFEELEHESFEIGEISESKQGLDGESFQFGKSVFKRRSIVAAINAYHNKITDYQI